MFLRLHKRGCIEVITGPMFSGKTSELLKRIDILKRSKEKIQVFSSVLDHRYGKNVIANHLGHQWPAIAIKDSNDLKEKINKDTTVVVIDEIQFFKNEIINFIEALANSNVRVIVAGLATNFRGEPFTTTTNLLARAEFVTKLASVCAVCQGLGTRVQRLTNGHPALASEKTIVLGGSDIYEARCRHCHEVPQA